MPGPDYGNDGLGEVTMRPILVTAAVLVVSVSGALAGPLAPGVAQDGLEFGGVF